MKNWIFDDLFHKKGLVLVIWVLGPGARDDQSIKICIFWWNEAVEVIEAIEAVEATEVIDAAEVLRPSLKIITEDFRVIQAFEFSLILMFWKKVFWGRIMKYHIEFLHLFCQSLLRPG